MEQAIWQIVVVSILLSISAIAKAIQDKLQFHFDKSVFSKAKNLYFWNPIISWKNKYKNRDKKQGEKFLGSSTILVSLTDGWHLFGLIRDISIYSCIPILSGNYWLFLGYPIYRLIFHLFFTYILTKRN